MKSKKGMEAALQWDGSFGCTGALIDIVLVLRSFVILPSRTACSDAARVGSRHRLVPGEIWPRWGVVRCALT